MREGWSLATMGELTRRRTDFTAVDPDAEYVILGVQRSGWGFVRRDPIRGSDQKFAKLMRIETDDLVYRTITAFEAPSAVAGPAENGLFVTPQTFPVFQINASRLLPRYMALLTTWPTFHEEMSSRCTGTVLRRKTLSIGAFESIPVPLPSLGEQRRIVRLMDAADAAIAAAGSALMAATKILEATRILASTGASRALGDLATMRSGPSWKASDEAMQPAEGHEPVLGITNTPPGLRLKLEDKKFVLGLPTTAQRLDTVSLVMIRTNGNRARIGNVYRATKEVEGFAVSAFQIAMRPHDESDAAFLYWFLGSSDVQSAISENASGSTGLGNIAIGWLKKLAVPVLSPEEMTRYVGRCEAAAAVVEATNDELTQLRRLRSNLLSALLSGEHEIPASYDAMLGATI